MHSRTHVRRVTEALALVITMTISAGGHVVDTPKMRVEFEDGWMIRWQNKETGEDVLFGRPDVDPARTEDLPYVPGPWFVEWQKPKDPLATGATWDATIKATDDETVELVQQATREGDGVVQAVQWGLRLPFDQIDAFHYPRGLGAAQIASKEGTGGTLASRSYYFKKRSAQLSFHGWRHRYFLVQGKTGGLLIYVDDPELNHRPALEFRHDDDAMVISNRSIMPPPWKQEYTGCRWVIRQYTGWVGQGAQIYQDYLADAYDLTPLSERPTAWVQKLAYAAVKPGMEEPLPHPGKRRRTFNFVDGWEESFAWREQWLDNLAEVLEPAKVMFYFTGWDYPGMDTLYPDHSINPFFAYMAPRVKRRGYHTALHFNAHYAFAPSVGFTRFLEDQWRQQGREDKPGIQHCALRNRTFISTHTPSSFYKIQGVNFTSTRHIFTPAYEPWRRVWVASVVSAIKATGADIIHVDVPAITIDMRNDLYGMNTAQGLRAEFRLLRETLDENGLEHVAIATELTPSEPILPYVDMAQTVRDVTIRDSLDTMVFGQDDELVELQGGEGEQELLDNLAASNRKGLFDGNQAREMIAKDRALGEPAVDAMVMGKYMKGYPHLGALETLAGGRHGGPDSRAQNHALGALKIWYCFAHDTLLHDIFAAPALMDHPRFDTEENITKRREQLIKSGLRENGFILTKLDYYKFALARFWQEHSPTLAKPGEWQRGDIARYHLDDGRVLRATRAGGTTLRLAFADGQVLADLDVFDGWQDHARLDPYAPTWLKDQIDEFAKPQEDPK